MGELGRRAPKGGLTARRDSSAARENSDGEDQVTGGALY